MKKEITVTVTKTDIAKGERKGRCTCPIARALKRCLPKADGIYVYPASVWVHLPAVTSLSIGHLPPDAKRFVERFDGGEAVEPFTFNLKFE